jgi:hypothetical protein
MASQLACHIQLAPLHGVARGDRVRALGRPLPHHPVAEDRAGRGNAGGPTQSEKQLPSPLPRGAQPHAPGAETRLWVDHSPEPGEQPKDGGHRRRRVVQEQRAAARPRQVQVPRQRGRHRHIGPLRATPGDGKRGAARRVRAGRALLQRADSVLPLRADLGRDVPKMPCSDVGESA